MAEEEKHTVGVDEAGRGCLFGPVVAAAVILPETFPDDTYKQIKDSKKLTPKRRDVLAKYIKEHAIAYGIGIIDNNEIDNINILRATFNAMHQALHQVYKKNRFNLIKVDGNRFLPYMPPNPDDDCIPHECIIKGDNLVLSIAAASIIAKTTRDNIIKDMVDSNHDLQDKYKLLNHKGYGTKAHFDAIITYGLTPYHRKTFIHLNQPT